MHRGAELVPDMRGHSTPAEERRIEDLERRIDLTTSPIADLLTLGLLYMEPAHEEESSKRCFEAILAREPDFAHARIWLAYVLEHHDMDRDSLRRALDILQPLRAPGSPERAAGLFLSALIGREAEDLSLSQATAWMGQSVAEEPSWVSNRHMLGKFYMDAGRFKEALVHLRAALDNFAPPHPSWDVQTENYECLITWRSSDYVQDRLRRIIRACEAKVGTRFEESST